MYKVATISANRVLIFTMNYSMLMQLLGLFELKKFSRRIQIEKVPDDFLKARSTMVNVHIYGNVNVVSLSDLEKERIEQNKTVLAEARTVDKKHW